VTGQALGILLVLLSAAAFGSGALFVQPLYAAGMEPLAVLFWRFTTAALFAWGFLLLASGRRRSLRALTRRRVVVLLLLGTLYVGNSFAFVAALQVVSISLTSIIAYLYPAIVAVMATRFVRRLEGRRAWLALGISLVGIVLTVGGIPAGELPPTWGLVLAFINPVIYATWIVLQARLAGERPTRPSVAVGSRPEPRGGVPEPGGDVVMSGGDVVMSGGDVVMSGGDVVRTGGDVVRTMADREVIPIPPGEAEVVTASPDPSPAVALMTTATALAYALLLLASGGSTSPLDVPDGTWPALLGLGLLATAVAIGAFYAGVRRVGGARASLISTVEPVYTVALAMILFGEQLTTLQLAGGALVIGAVILAETGRPDTVARDVD
jgi:drug/metabolite transporter (DMT)-like permease